MSQSVRYDVEHGVARITLQRPAAYNSLNLELLDQLAEAVADADADAAVGGILLTGEGRAFCAGGDVASLRQIADSPDPRGTASQGVDRMHRVLRTLFRCPKPVVAAVNGPTAGAGVGLMLTADVVWAARSASFTLAFTAIGASPDGGTTFLLPRAVGPKLAAELLLTNRTLDAEAARDAGLVNGVLDDDALLDAAFAQARALAAGPSEAFARAKELLRKSVYGGYDDQLDAERDSLAGAAESDDFREGVSAFLEKRPPRFGPR